MPERVKIDEDLPREVADRFREAGHDAHTVTEQNMSGTPDGELWKRIQGEGRWLVTADKGFVDARVCRSSADTGVVLLRSPRESRKRYLTLTDFLLKALDMEQARGAIVVVTPEAIRIHRQT